jgi:subtilisin family serine protease
MKLAFPKQRNLFQDLYMKQIHLWAREKNLTGKGVSVAVIDSGIRRQVEILKNSIAKIPNTSKWRENTTEELDKYIGTHGTEVACLINEVFPYLKSTPAMPPSPQKISGVGGEEERMTTEQEIGNVTLSARGRDFGFTKTLPFTQNGINEMKKLVEFLESQIPETEESKKIKKKE